MSKNYLTNLKQQCVDLKIAFNEKDTVAILEERLQLFFNGTKNDISEQQKDLIPSEKIIHLLKLSRIEMSFVQRKYRSVSHTKEDWIKLLAIDKIFI